MSLNYGLHFTGGNHSSIFLLDLVADENYFRWDIWCGDDEVTMEKLNELKEAEGILIGVNPFITEEIRGW